MANLQRPSRSSPTSSTRNRITTRRTGGRNTQRSGGRTNRRARTTRRRSPTRRQQRSQQRSRRSPAQSTPYVASGVVNTTPSFTNTGWIGTCQQDAVPPTALRGKLSRGRGEGYYFRNKMGLPACQQQCLAAKAWCGYISWGKNWCYVYQRCEHRFQMWPAYSIYRLDLVRVDPAVLGRQNRRSGP